MVELSRGNEFNDRYSRPEDFFSFDGYDVHWGSLSINDAIDGGSVSRAAIEDILIGQSEEESQEDREIQLERALRKVGINPQTYLLYYPGANYYSSLRQLGLPASSVPAFGQ